MFSSQVASVPKVEGVSLSHLSDITIKTSSNTLPDVSSDVSLKLENELNFYCSNLPKTSTDWSAMVDNIMNKK